MYGHFLTMSVGEEIAICAMTTCAVGALCLHAWGSVRVTAYGLDVYCDSVVCEFSFICSGATVLSSLWLIPTQPSLRILTNSYITRTNKLINKSEKLPPTCGNTRRRKVTLTRPHIPYPNVSLKHANRKGATDRSFHLPSKVWWEGARALPVPCRGSCVSRARASTQLRTTTPRTDSKGRDTS